MSWADEELEDLAARCDAAFPVLTTEERAIALARDDWESWNRQQHQATFVLTVDKAWRPGT